MRSSCLAGRGPPAEWECLQLYSHTQALWSPACTPRCASRWDGCLQTSVTDIATTPFPPPVSTSYILDPTLRSPSASLFPAIRNKLSHMLSQSDTPTFQKKTRASPRPLQISISRAPLPQEWQLHVISTLACYTPLLPNLLDQPLIRHGQPRLAL